MNNEKFMDKNTRAFQEELKKVLEEQTQKEYSVEPVSVPKVGGPKQGFSCRACGDDYGVIVYPEDYANKSIETVAEAVVEGKSNVPPFHMSAEDFKANLFLEVVNTERNQDLLNGCVYDNIEDLSAVARCRISSSESGTVSFLVTNDFLPYFKLTRDEVMDYAYQNTSLQQFSIKNITEALMENFSDDNVSREDISSVLPESPLYVITNENNVYGANVIACSSGDGMKEAWEKLGDFYLLPSSIHECLLISKDEAETVGGAESLRELVREVNATEVSPQDFLSDNIYFFNGRKLSLVKGESQEKGFDIKAVAAKKSSHLSY